MKEKTDEGGKAGCKRVWGKMVNGLVSLLFAVVPASHGHVSAQQRCYLSAA